MESNPLEKPTLTVRLCKSCTRDNARLQDITPFLNEVKEKLTAQRPDQNWNIERTYCMRVCPESKISMTVSSSNNPSDVRLTVSKEATVDSVVNEVLSFLRPI